MCPCAVFLPTVLVVGAGGGGMYAAIEAVRRGANTLLLDRGLIGRDGATVMARITVAVMARITVAVMARITVAAAVGPEATDHGHKRPLGRRPRLARSGRRPRLARSGRRHAT
jgi:2-polyprenyl-6-methoxyphenol hydroxylase-like FAD-dependent oxidoreductase